MQHEMFPFPCPICHGSGIVPRLPLVTGYIRSRMFDLILRATHGEGICAEELFGIIYGQAADGGPRTGIRVISMLVCHANKQLRPQGYEIKCRWRGGRGGHGPYVLVKLDADPINEPARDQNAAGLDERPQSAGTAGLY